MPKAQSPFIETSALGDANDTDRIRADIQANPGKTIYFPGDRIYQIHEMVEFWNTGIIGDGPWGPNSYREGGTKFEHHGEGYAMAFGSYRGQKRSKFSVVSTQPNQSGIIVGGMHPILEQIHIIDMEGVGLRMGNGSAGEVHPSPSERRYGAYYAQVRGVRVSLDHDKQGIRALFNDGPFPSTNANSYYDVTLQGPYEYLAEINGTNNKFYGGDFVSVNKNTQQQGIIKIGGNHIRVDQPYHELPGGDQGPERLYHFTDESFACAITDVHSQIVCANLSSMILDEGWANKVDYLPVGYNYKGTAQTKDTATELITNQGFDPWLGNAPEGWTNWGGNWVQSTEGMGSGYAAELVAQDSRGNLTFRLFGDDVTDLEGKTVVASVWCWSDTPGLGNLKIGTSPGPMYGNDVHSGSGQWEQLAAIAKIPQGHQSVNLSLRTDGDGRPKTGTMRFYKPMFQVL